MASVLGIDWGTHSSKWAFQTESGNPVIGSIWDSSVYRLDDRLHLFTLDRGFQAPRRETALKRRLIQDPGQPFWDGIREQLGVTLGEAVVFSILCLLLDAKRTLAARRKSLLQEGSLVIRFSHPNWIAEDTVRALGCFRDAAVVAMHIFLQAIDHKNDAQEISIALDALRTAVQRHRGAADRLSPFPLYYDHREYLRCAQGKVHKTKWELVFESCAAGFPYLLESEPGTYVEDLTTFPALKRIRTVLVIDVGAGSTDAGYMVRTVRPRNAQGIMKPLLHWLPAADALEIAGRWLTDRILADFRQQGRPGTSVEAEEYKITNQTWYTKPYVGQWTTLIGDHVAEYVRGIRDDLCLARSPALEVVLTGGSSVVSPLREETIRQVRTALEQRGLRQAAQLLDVARPDALGRRYRAVEVAQLAVSLGASDPRLTELKAAPEGLVAPRGHTRHA